ncbi:MAG TPA: hypothetical protein VMT16_01820 [Thermoanaerobaculia bacterium]|nr:hypothetical protein [Thermoanaerobaculia bacterium]
MRRKRTIPDPRPVDQAAVDAAAWVLLQRRHPEAARSVTLLLAAGQGPEQVIDAVRRRCPRLGLLLGPAVHGCVEGAGPASAEVATRAELCH